MISIDKKIGLLFLCVLFCWKPFVVCQAEDTQVLGTVSFSADFEKADVEIVESQLVLLEEFVPSPLPAPAEFDSWSQKQRSEWFAEWKITKAGQEYQKKEEKRFKQLKKHEAKIQKNVLGFTFEKVQSGSYDLAGEIRINHKSRQYVAEFYAKVKVSDVKEVRLKTIPLDTIRVLKIGEEIPPLTVNGKSLLNKKQMSRKMTFVVFWSRTYGINEQLAKHFQSIGDAENVQIVAIGVGGKTDQKVIAPNSDFNGFVKGVDSTICKDWGVRSMPAFWLVDRKGKILATPSEIIEKRFKLDDWISNLF